MEIDALKYWSEQIITKTQSTKDSYHFLFKGFIDWAHTSPNELIQMAKEAKNHSDDPRENKVLETKVKAYLSYLKDQGAKDCTLAANLTAIKSFFTSNCFPLNISRKDLSLGEPEGSRIPEKEEIRKILIVAKSHRATILFLKDSGLRISDVVRLTWSGMKDYGEGFRGWTVKTKKKGIIAHAFIGPEASEALDALKRKPGEERVFPLDPQWLSNAISLIINEAKLEGVSAHGLRKYFNCELQAARVDQQHRYVFMGKAVSAYDEKRESQLLEIYKNAYSNLRVFGADSADVIKLEKKTDELRTENTELRERLRKIEEARGPSDQIMNQLFEDQEFKAVLAKKLKELKT